jgi:hypothetical protein
MLKKVVRRVRRGIEHLIDATVPGWIAPRLRLAHHYLENGDAEKAIAIADDVLRRTPDLCMDTQTFHRFASIYYLAGRHEDTRRAFERTEERRREVARERQYDRLRLRLFPGGNIGHLGCLDRFVKAEILGMIPRCVNVIIGDPANFANLAYVGYWEKYFSRITNRRTISYLAPLLLYLEERSTWTWCGGDFPALARKAQLKWEAEDRGPLL